MNLRQLNGWQRLWLVASALWCAWTVLFMVPKFPTEREQLKFWANSIAFNVIYSNPDQSFYQQNKTSTDIRKAHSDLSDRQFIEMAPKIYPNVDNSGTLALYRSDMQDLTKNQLEGIAAIALLMFVPPTIVYGIGLVIAWILAGFRKA